jgi:hypothetical protein
MDQYASARNEREDREEILMTFQRVTGRPQALPTPMQTEQRMLEAGSTKVKAYVRTSSKGKKYTVKESMRTLLIPITRSRRVAHARKDDPDWKKSLIKSVRQHIADEYWKISRSKFGKALSRFERHSRAFYRTHDKLLITAEKKGAVMSFPHVTQKNGLPTAGQMQLGIGDLEAAKKKKTKSEKKVEKVMDLWKEGRLHTGKKGKGKGPVVPRTESGQKKALAIGLSYSRSKKRKSCGR